MLNDLAVFEAKQVECDRRSRVTCDALVPGMQQDEVPVHERAMDRYVGAWRARYLLGKRLHPGKTVGKVRVMLYERLAEVAIDCCPVLVPEDVDHGFVGAGAPQVEDGHK